MIEKKSLSSILNLNLSDDSPVYWWIVHLYSRESASSLWLMLWCLLICVRWRKGGAVHAPGAAVSAAQQHCSSSRRGDRQHASVGGAGVAEIRWGVQGHDCHQPWHGKTHSHKQWHDVRWADWIFRYLWMAQRMMRSLFIQEILYNK